MANRKLYTVSNAHLDTQWNWTIQDTIRDCIRNTMDVNFAHFENNPNYRFNFEGAFHYKLAKEYYPEKFEKLKEYVKAGRWNVCGSSWEACDTNVPSSEAFMRQILYGNGWWEKELGARSLDIFLPDCFGFRYALPSIAAHMGLIGFSTQKLVWGVGMPRYEGNGVASKPLPKEKSDLPQVDLCRWVGPDGNSIIGSFNEGNYTYNYNYDSDAPLYERENYLHDIEHNEQIAGISRRSMYYGAGDYGGGPNPVAAKLVSDAVDHQGEGLFDVLSSSPYDIFTDLTEEELKTLPTYRGNLNIPHGYGAMVSHTISKRWNRKCELLADRAERAASIANWLGASDYPSERLTTAWQTFLWHQFHDDVTGTSIGEAYGYSYNDYVIALNTLASELTASVGAAAKCLKTSVPGTPVVLFNAVASERNEAVTVRFVTEAPFARVFDGETEIPSQCVREGNALLVTVAPTLDPVSVKVFSLRPSDAPCALSSSLRADENTIENARFRVQVGKDGNVCSVYDKSLAKELLSAPIHFELMPDTIVREYPSWEYKYEDFGKPFDTVEGLTGVSVTENGPVRASLKITRDYRGSLYETTVSLTEGGQRVDFDNRVEWGTREAMLRASFPTSASGDTAFFDQGLGAEEQGTSNEAPYYQYSVQQWAYQPDRSGDFGVSVFNDCKYSMDKPDDHTLRLTLIRTPAGDFRAESMQSYQDLGTNLFRFSLSAHKGADRDGVSALAECVNQPVDAFFVPAHDGKHTSLSFASLSDPALVLRCVKKEEKGGRIVVRVQETSGKAVKDCRLTFLADIDSAVETDGYETEKGKAAFDGSSLLFDMTPYQVRTFALTLKAPCACRRCEKDEFTALPLDFDTETTSKNGQCTKGRFFENIAIPEELMPDEVLSGGIPFPLKKDGKNALKCAGQTLSLPEGTEEVDLLVSSDGDRAYTFTLGGNALTRTVPCFGQRIGTWDQVATGAGCSVRHEELGVNFTHTHGKMGDRLYEFANLYILRLPTGGADTLTLPDGDLLVFSALARKTLSPAEASVLYDEVKPGTTPVTVKDGTGTGLYPAGKIVPVSAYVLPDGQFDAWDDGNTALHRFVRVGTEPISLTASRKAYPGVNVLPGCIVTCSGELNNYNRAIYLTVPDNNNKWCSVADLKGEWWARFDLPEEVRVGSWTVCHAGVRENADFNASAYRLQYLDGDEWKDADVVAGNTENVVEREFAPVCASSFRLFLDKPAQTDEPVVRIYQVRLYQTES